jgi:hypothetical protein
MLSDIPPPTSELVQLPFTSPRTRLLYAINGEGHNIIQGNFIPVTSHYVTFNYTSVRKWVHSPEQSHDAGHVIFLIQGVNGDKLSSDERRS